MPLISTRSQAFEPEMTVRLDGDFQSLVVKRELPTFLWVRRSLIDHGFEHVGVHDLTERFEISRTTIQNCGY